MLSTTASCFSRHSTAVAVSSIGRSSNSKGFSIVCHRCSLLTASAAQHRCSLIHHHHQQHQHQQRNVLLLCSSTTRNHARCLLRGGGGGGGGRAAKQSPLPADNGRSTSRLRQCMSSSSAPSTKSSSTSSSSSNSTSLFKKKLLGDEAIIPCRSILPLSFVNHPHVVLAVPVIGNLAYICLSTGFLMTDMLTLRILLTLGYTGLVTFHILRPVPLRIPLRWSAVFVLVNAGAAFLLIADQYLAPLSQEQQQLYQDYFSILTPGQFYQLMSLATKEELEDQTILTIEGTPCPKLYFIQSGGAQVYHHKDHASNIEAGGFVNDVAFQRSTGENQVGAYGTVVASGKISALVWDQTKLREHLSSRPAMDRNLKYILSDHLVKSLLRQREAAHARQRRLLLKRRERDEALLSSSTSTSGSTSSSSSSSAPSTSNTENPQNATISRSPSQHHVSW